MYNWTVGFNSKKAAEKYFTEQFGETFHGLGMYLSDDDTALLTITDKNGERGIGEIPDGDCSLRLYVFGCPFNQTLFALTCRTAVDDRT